MGAAAAAVGALGMDLGGYTLDTPREELEETAKRFTLEGIIERERDSGCVLGPFERQWLNARAPEKVQRHLAKLAEHRQAAAERGRLAPLVGPLAARQGFASMDVADFPPSSFTAVTASATETNLWTQTVWTPVPAGDMRQGKVYKLSFGGVFTSTGTPGTLTWTPREGTSATPGSNHSLGASGAIAPPASQSGQAWYGEFTFGIRTQDLALTAITGTGNGFVVVGGTSTVAYVLGGTVPTNVSNAAATALIMSLTISVASQSYQAQWALIRSYN